MKEKAIPKNKRRQILHFSCMKLEREDLKAQKIRHICRKGIARSEIDCDRCGRLIGRLDPCAAITILQKGEYKSNWEYPFMRC